MATIDTRRDQMFPVLGQAQMETARRFASGPERRFAPGEALYEIGTRGAPSWLVLAGSVEIVRRDGLSHEAPITTIGAGQFTGEVNQLAGRAAIASAHAGAQGALPVPALQRAWRQHGRQWIGLYGQRRAQNAGYVSVSVPVPRGVLMQAIVEAMFVS